MKGLSVHTPRVALSFVFLFHGIIEHMRDEHIAAAILAATGTWLFWGRTRFDP